MRESLTPEWRQAGGSISENSETWEAKMPVASS
jgi:hypothetical protein